MKREMRVSGRGRRTEKWRMVGRASCMAIDMVNGVLVEGTGVMDIARKSIRSEKWVVQ